ncbi:MAG: hypothetical protein HYY13_03350 [Nitrospirae bacterium]|nr:hypothetical protein [Nitrospirota bacterium]
MGKPVLKVTLTTADQKARTVPGLFDTGSFYTIVRSDCVPSGNAVAAYKTAHTLGTAKRRAKVRVVGDVVLVIRIGRKIIRSPAFVSPDLQREFIIGAETMQAWDITIRNRNGKTKVIVGRDMRDPEVTEVD